MSTGGFNFAQGNLSKLLALPKYLLSVVVSWFVPRSERLWVFGSGIGVAEGALVVARQLLAEEPDAAISWLVSDEDEAEIARAEGFTPVVRQSAAGYWATLRAGRIIVTHGLGDANRFGVMGGCIVQLWHGAPLKRLHLDSQVTTAVRGPAPLRGILRRMYLAGSRQVALFVAGSPLAAERLRTAFRVDPGKVRALGDPRDDALSIQAADPVEAGKAREQLRETLGLSDEHVSPTSMLFLYAPTWRDGGADPAAPNQKEIGRLRMLLEQHDAHMLIRSHPLGAGAYEEMLGDRVHLLSAETVREVTPMLGGVDAVITDYSSIAVDFSLLGRPIIWFAPDLEHYESTRGLYEPLMVTSAGRVERSWAEVLDRLERLQRGNPTWRAAEADTRAFARRFHRYPEGGAAARVLTEIRRLRLRDRALVPPGGVFFESYYGRQVSCNPLAIDREIAERFPDVPRYWSVTSEDQAVPDGATPLLVGGREWLAARRTARLLVVNDWLRYSFHRKRGQTVLQTWHGTMLKHLALGRPNVGLRTRLAIRRESRRWSLLLSQNPHSTSTFKSSYAFRGEVLELGYPRDDRLARAVIAEGRNPIEVAAARAALGIPAGVSVLSYVPTWRDGGITLVDDLNVRQLARELGDEWVVIVRGHTRTHAFGRYLGSAAGIAGQAAAGTVIDASHHDDVNDVILASDLLVTDYSSIMFDAAVARVPQLFFVPDLAAYRDRERGFTFDFERLAPGPLISDRVEVRAHAQELRELGQGAAWVREFAVARDNWREQFAPHDDGYAARRVVDALIERGALRG